MTDSINANVVVSMPSQLFTMARSFKAVANGKIYIGKIDTDPVNPENQIQVYVENEDGSHIPVSQPIIINAAGYPVYNGQIAKFVTVQGHSMAVYDTYGTQQFYFPNILKYDPDQLRQQIEDPDGATKYPELQMARWKDVGDVRAWGAKGDGVTDDTVAIQSACSALLASFSSDGIQRTLVFPDGKYMTSDTIVAHPNMRILCIGRVVFQNKTTNKTFAAFELQGRSRKTVLGTIDSYGAGFILRDNTQDVEFHTISNCVDALIIRADNNWTLGSKNNLDNKITGVQIGKCTNGIVFEQNADSLVQQGNEIRVNFISETNNSAVFRTFGGFTHTKPSNWDSNYIELAASDPLSLPDSSMIRNATGFAVPNLTFKVTSWCGGWTANAGTICLIRGAFSTGRFTFNLAASVGLAEVVDDSGKASYGSCSVDLCRHSNLGSATTFFTAVTPGASFNGGVAVQNDKFRVRVTVPDLSAGQTFASSFWHILVQRSDTARVRLEQYSDKARGKYLIELRDAGTEQQGMVRIWITNFTSATVTGRDIDLVISAN
ncbi:TPA: hypothetical protein QDA17_000037 [Escherichia coli]|nr:hypothetical protein [Escherichia coli]